MRLGESLEATASHVTHDLVATLEDLLSILSFAKKLALPYSVYDESADQFGVEHLSSLRLLLALHA